LLPAKSVVLYTERERLTSIIGSSPNGNVGRRENLIMPTYEFVCKGCNNRFSLFTTVSGRDNACCPKCEGRDLQQVFKGVRFSTGGYSDVGAGSASSGASGCAGKSCSGCSGCG
jgi:putative FmdB family regulatory protein